jgi:hypothetical protein
MMNLQELVKICKNIFIMVSISFKGNQDVVISGKGFNSSIGKVYFGNNSVEVIEYSKDEIKIKTPALKPGIYSVKIPCGPLGDAWLAK